jgi:4-aminobutyrate aminotransferase-like enzyme
LFAYTRYGIEPDIVLLGKGLGNGIPVSAAVGQAAVMHSLNYGEGSDTWSANPLAAAAVLATLDEFADGQVLDHAEQLAAVLEAGLLRMCETGVVAAVRGEGGVWGIECCQVGRHSPGDVANSCVRACYLGNDAGLAVHLLGPLSGKVIRVAPPLVMPLDEARQYLEVMYELFVGTYEQLSRS